MDGGSTDGTVEIIKKYEKHLAYWESGKDHGQADALARGFSRATGKILAYINSDDVYLPGAFYEVAHAYLREPNAGIFAGNLCHCDVQGYIYKCHIPLVLPKWLSKVGIIGFWQPSSFFNGVAYKAIGGINPEFYFRMDADLFHRLLLHNPHIVILNRVIASFRVHAAAKSTSKLDIHKKELNMFLKEEGVSSNMYYFASICFRILRICNLTFFKSLFLTLRFYGKNISTLWKPSAN